jgi:hypothetical protein
MRRVPPWLEYRWDFGFPAGMYHAVLARLRGTPARLEDLLHGRDPAALVRRPNGTWSPLEHAGHLLVLDRTVHASRLEQYLRGDAELVPADMSNRATSAAGFNERRTEDLLREVRTAREGLLLRLEPLELPDVERVALHPRLKCPMRLVDMCYFVAGHDDHHLARIHEIL